MTWGTRSAALVGAAPYLIPTTIETGPTRCLTSVSRNPTSRAA
jgi:hypothetical protein